MRKLVCLLFGICLFFAGINAVNANESSSNEITFIYINGSNNLAYKNRQKFEISFEENVKKLHPEIKKRFENDESTLLQ